MAAWQHTQYWDAAKYEDYRQFVTRQAPHSRGHFGLDCADLSTVFLIHFAAGSGLPVTFKDMDHVRYISKGERQTPDAILGSSWTNRLQYIQAVTNAISTESLWHRNTEINPNGPQPGDLMMALGGGMHHTALVYRVYPPGTPHPHANDQTVPDFPGDDIARVQRGQTEYFRSRQPDGFVHIDYLNYRSRRKGVAELIYFASAELLRQDGFQFRKWRGGVIDNWTDWNGRGDPPR